MGRKWAGPGQVRQGQKRGTGSLKHSVPRPASQEPQALIPVCRLFPRTAGSPGLRYGVCDLCGSQPQEPYRSGRLGAKCGPSAQGEQGVDLWVGEGGAL